MNLNQLAAVILLEKDKAYVDYYDAVYAERFTYGDPTTAKWNVRFERSGHEWSAVVTERTSDDSWFTHVVETSSSKPMYPAAEIFKFFRKIKNSL